MTLTPEQQRALDELFASVPGSLDDHAAPAQPDFLQTWFGVSGSELTDQLQKLLRQKDAAEQQLLDFAKRNPLDAAMGFLFAATIAFYAAEKEVNPRVKTFVDAFYYIATCASVGYADIFALTQTGRAIASLVMIVGPALTNSILDAPTRSA